MKKTPLLRSTLFVACSIISVALFSCKKEAFNTQQPSPINIAVAVDSEISTAIAPIGVTGKYFNRGSRIVYKGRAGQDNAILSLDYFNEKKVVPAFDRKSLTCGYGETNFVNKGWKYIIRYDVEKGVITLAPNDLMVAAIQPNSFRTLSATYDATTKTFSFMTRFMDANGNENEVFDVMTKE